MKTLSGGKIVCLHVHFHIGFCFQNKNYQITHIFPQQITKRSSTNSHTLVAHGKHIPYSALRMRNNFRKCWQPEKGLWIITFRWQDHCWILHEIRKTQGYLNAILSNLFKCSAFGLHVKSLCSLLHPLEDKRRRIHHLRVGLLRVSVCLIPEYIMRMRPDIVQFK